MTITSEICHVSKNENSPSPYPPALPRSLLLTPMLQNGALRDVMPAYRHVAQRHERELRHCPRVKIGGLARQDSFDDVESALGVIGRGGERSDG